MKKNLSKNSTPDYVFIFLLVLLTTFGLVMLMSASSDLAKLQFGDSFYYLKHQILFGLLPGIVGFILGFFLNYKTWQKASLYLLIIGVFFLLLVFTPLGFKAYGSDRWLHLGSFGFQPSEFVKIALILYIASWLSKTSSRRKSFKEGTLPFFVILLMVIVPIVLQPATSTAVLITSAALIMYLIAGADLKSFAFLVIIGLLGLALLVAITPYRFQRVFGFLHPSSDTLGKTYQINQSLIAIGSGGVSGVGYGRSTTKLNYLPEPMGDSIFAVIAEELGFVGSVFLILLFLMFVWRGIKIGRHAPDMFSELAVIGFVSVIGLQAFVHMGAVSGVLPFTGVPLPFTSYGGTALAVFLTMSGIVANVSRYSRL
ncbi:putative lipid II flippase FtsW [Patescibacteria group bacterium]|nr:putative lipid II flippase FtsW [Patescibacteria group bacterium]